MDKEKILKSRTIIVTPAELKAIVATDKTLIEAPGAGKCIVPVRAVLTLDFVTTAYAWANTDHTLGFNLGGIAAANDAGAQALVEAASRLSVAWQAAAQATLSENTALLLQAGGTGEPTLGDSNLLVEVFYYVVDVTGDND
jgi:hypothetical protein